MLEEVHEHAGSMGNSIKKLVKKPIFLVGVGLVGVIALFMRSKNNSEPNAVAIDSYPQAPADQSGIGNGSVAGVNQDDLQSLFNQNQDSIFQLQDGLKQSQSEMFDYFNNTIQQQIAESRQQAVEQYQQQYAISQPVVQTVVPTQSATDWNYSGDGIFGYGNTGVTFKPEAETTSLPTSNLKTSSGKTTKSTDLTSNSPSGLYNYSKGTFTPGKVSVPAIDNSKGTITQSGNKYNYNGKSYSNLNDAAKAAGAKGW
jgi:hypothetical protein